MAIVIDNKWDIGDTVYLKTDKEQLPRIIFRFIVYRNEILYELATGTINSSHYDFEISSDKNILIECQ
jgi:hypothetical protein